MVNSTKYILNLNFPRNIGSDQPSNQAVEAGATSSSCSFIHTAPCMEYYMVSSTRGHYVKAPRQRSGLLKQPLSELGDRMTSSSFSLTLTECCMAFIAISFTKGVRQQLLMTTGLDPPHWWGQVDGRSSSASSSMHRETYSASKTASYTRGVLPNTQVTAGQDRPHSLARRDEVIFSSFSSRWMVSCMASMKISCTSFHNVTTGRPPRRSSVKMAGPSLNS